MAGQEVFDEKGLFIDHGGDVVDNHSTFDPTKSSSAVTQSLPPAYDSPDRNGTVTSFYALFSSSEAEVYLC